NDQSSVLQIEQHFALISSVLASAIGEAEYPRIHRLMTQPKQCWRSARAIGGAARGASCSLFLCRHRVRCCVSCISICSAAFVLPCERTQDCTCPCEFQSILLASSREMVERCTRICAAIWRTFPGAPASQQFSRESCAPERVDPSQTGAVS